MLHGRFSARHQSARAGGASEAEHSFHQVNLEAEREGGGGGAALEAHLRGGAFVPPG